MWYGMSKLQRSDKIQENQVTCGPSINDIRGCVFITSAENFPSCQYHIHATSLHWSEHIPFTLSAAVLRSWLLRIKFWIWIIFPSQHLRPILSTNFMQPPLLHLLTDLSPQLIIHLLMVPKYKRVRVRVNQQYKVKYRIIFCNKFLVNSLN